LTKGIFGIIFDNDYYFQKEEGLGEKEEFRVTRQRRVILEELRKMKTHPTADEVYEVVRKKLPRISLATVYRNLEMLAREGIIKKLEMGGGPKRFDGDIKPHHHICCIRCGRVDDIYVDIPFPITDNVRKATPYKIIGYRFELVGLCPKCLKEGKGSKE